MTRLTSISPQESDDIVVFIPRDIKGGSYEARIKRAVRWLWSRGIYPGPTAVSLRLHGHTRPSRSLNGKETKIRNELLLELGISRQRKYKIDSIHIKPEYEPLRISSEPLRISEEDNRAHLAYGYLA